MHRNDTKKNMNQLLDVIYIRVRLSGVDSLSPATALLITTILEGLFLPAPPFATRGKRGGVGGL
jgi:hypothetical protein